MPRLALILVCFIGVPNFSLAAISITEIAWMGDSTSANYEWIELYNDGSESVDVTDWELSDSMNLTIPLAGTIPGNSYVMVERNRSSESYLKNPPFLVYTGALVNTGATLTLRRAGGVVEDQIAGGENWETIGGDNSTKETAQYTTQGWVTAAATPGRATTATIQDPDPEEEEEDQEDDTDEEEVRSESKKSSSHSSETVRLELRDITLAVDIDMQSVAYVNQAVVMKATAKDIGRSLQPSVQYEWNFGDMSTGSGAEVTHVYRYPGTYIVTVYGYYKRQVHLTRHEITVLPVSMTMTRNEDGDIQVHNNSTYDVDVSGYTIVGATNAVFPPYSIMQARSTVTIPWSKVADYPEQTISLFDSGARVITRSPTASTLSVAATEVVTQVPAPLPTLAQYAITPVADPNQGTSLFQFASTTKEVTTTPVVASTTDMLLPNPVVAPIPAKNKNQTSIVSSTQAGPVIVFIILLLSAISVVYLTHKPESASDRN